MDELEAFYERWVNIHNRVHADVFINGHTDKDFARATLKTMLVELRPIIDALSITE